MPILESIEGLSSSQNPHSKILSFHLVSLIKLEPCRDFPQHSTRKEIPTTLQWPKQAFIHLGNSRSSWGFPICRWRLGSRSGSSPSQVRTSPKLSQSTANWLCRSTNCRNCFQGELPVQERTTFRSPGPFSSSTCESHHKGPLSAPYKPRSKTGSQEALPASIQGKARRVPSLVWLSDGRTVHQRQPCSQVLLREVHDSSRSRQRTSMATRKHTNSTSTGHFCWWKGISILRRPSSKPWSTWNCCLPG